MSGYYTINGKKIYVYMGNSNKMPILYIHGAPGIGVLDMEKYQSDNFYPKYFLIAPEQRGVWRSEDLKEDEPYNLDLIIEDYEQLRKQLKIEHQQTIEENRAKKAIKNMSDEEMKNILEITTQSGNDISFEDFCQYMKLSA